MNVRSLNVTVIAVYQKIIQKWETAAINVKVLSCRLMLFYFYFLILQFDCTKQIIQNFILQIIKGKGFG